MSPAQDPMDIKISPHNHRHRKHLEYAAWFFSLALMGIRMSNKLTIRIRTKDLLSDTTTSVRVGECSIDAYGCEPQRDFVITLERTLGIGRMIGTLAHEMVHVQQKVRNRLQVREDPNNEHISMNRWKGSIFHTDHRQSEAEMPWELEAAAVAEKLLDKYVLFLETCVEKDNFMHPLDFMEDNPVTVTPAHAFS